MNTATIKGNYEIPMTGRVAPSEVDRLRADNERLRAALEELLASCSYEGEVGLDASKRRIAAKKRAREALSN
jgi:hypothetical protein